MEQKITVAVAQCADYAECNVDQAVRDIFEQLGGIEQYVPQGSKVLLKANLVRDMSPEQAGTTHPAILTAIAKAIVDKCGASVVIGDSSGGAYSKGYMNTVYRKCRLTECEQSGYATLNQDFGSTDTNIDGVKLKHIDIMDCFLNADVVINVGKLKTHSFAGYSGAVKNLYGLIPGLVKVEVHSRFPDLNDFCQILMDLEKFASSKTVLNILDAVVCMEGAGPTNGKPRFVGKLIASADGYCCDYVATSLFSDPLSQPLLKLAMQTGVLEPRLDNLQFDFDSWHQCYIADYDRVEIINPNGFFNLPTWILKLAKKHLTPKVSMMSNCKACGKCAQHCPAQAITVSGGRARVEQSKCIRCFCCQELCPFDAVHLHKPMLYRIMRTLSKTKRSSANATAEKATK